MSKVDIQPTVDAVRHMAECLREKAAAMDRIAIEMLATGNIQLAASAVNLASLPVGNLDWLVIRPLRAVAEHSGTVKGNADLQAKQSVATA